MIKLDELFIVLLLGICYVLCLKIIVIVIHNLIKLI